jgi:hypothetical protein
MLPGVVSAALEPGFNPLVQQLPADRADYFFLAIQFIESVGFEHDTFPVRAVRQTKEMPNLMGTFLDNAIDEVVIGSPAAIIFIVQACSRDNARSHRFAGKAENKTVPFPEQVLVNNEQHGFGNLMPVLVCLDTVQQRLCINLLPYHVQTRNPHMIIDNRGFYAEDG